MSTRHSTPTLPSMCTLPTPRSFRLHVFSLPISLPLLQGTYFCEDGAPTRMRKRRCKAERARQGWCTISGRFLTTGCRVSSKRAPRPPGQPVTTQQPIRSKPTWLRTWQFEIHTHKSCRGRVKRPSFTVVSPAHFCSCFFHNHINEILQIREIKFVIPPVF